MSVLLIMASVLTAASPASSQRLMQAMMTEMDRSMAELSFDNHGPPYFMAYRVEELRSVEQGASMGALTQYEASHSRTAQVEVRLGSHSLDSSRVLRAPMSRSQIYDDFGGQFALPLEDDIAEIRRVFWLATDRAYKRAIEDLSVKRATLEAQGRLAEERADLLPGAPITDYADTPSPKNLGQGLTERLLALSRGFEAYELLQGSYAWLSVRHRVTHLVTSEGTRLRLGGLMLTLGMVARTQAIDGAELWTHRILRAKSEADVPDVSELEQIQAELIAELLAMRTAPRLDSYLGPVLFSGQASAALLAGILVPELTGVPEIYSADAALGSYAQRQADRVNRFARRIHSRVLPRGTLVVDDPVATTYAGKPLLGHFRIDDEGTPAVRKALITDGRLRSVLTTRTPVLDWRASSGSARAGSALPGNLFVSSNNALDERRMNNLVASLIQESGNSYAIEIERLLDRDAAARLLGTQSYRLHAMDPRKPGILVAYRRYPDGRREYVRNLAVEDISVGDFRYLAALGASPYVHHYHPPYTEAASWLPGFRPTQALVSLVTPAMLFEELSLSGAQQQNRRLPVLPPPASQK